MSYIDIEYPTEKQAFYDTLTEQLKLYTDGEDNLTAALANASSVIKLAFPDANWVGFYIVDKARDELVLGPFQGRPAVTRIGYGLGVCGTSWKERAPQVVENVECFMGHIACDCNTHSEIVIPLFDGDGGVWGVLDMDSVTEAYFTNEDRDGLIRAISVIERRLRGKE